MVSNKGKRKNRKRFYFTILFFPTQSEKCYFLTILSFLGKCNQFHEKSYKLFFYYTFVLSFAEFDFTSPTTNLRYNVDFTEKKFFWKITFYKYDCFHGKKLWNNFLGFDSFADF